MCEFFAKYPSQKIIRYSLFIEPVKRCVIDSIFAEVMVPAQINSTSIDKWPFALSRPVIIAGPCGVESEEQIAATAKELSKLNIQLLRGGIWKPRTRPDSFQGIGTEGLRWLKNAGIENNLPVTVEVANPNTLKKR
jgi:3-deoxy-D-arabino-heptulosonate 7-phosphate (DAHP) synthase